MQFVLTTAFLTLAESPLAGERLGWCEAKVGIRRRETRSGLLQLIGVHKTQRRIETRVRLKSRNPRSRRAFGF